MRLSSYPCLQFSPDLRPPTGFQEGEGKESWQWLEKTTSMIILSIRYLLGALLKGKRCGGEKVFRSQLCRKGKGLCRARKCELRSPCPALCFSSSSPPPAIIWRGGRASLVVKRSRKVFGLLLWRYDFVNQQAISELRDSGSSSSTCPQSKYLC